MPLVRKCKSHARMTFSKVMMKKKETHQSLLNFYEQVVESKKNIRT